MADDSNQRAAIHKRVRQQHSSELAQDYVEAIHEILDGGSLYWVIKGLVLCRQRVLRLDEVIGSDGVRRCGIVMERKLHRTTPAPRRPFQGWRYLPASDAPADLTESKGDDDALPVELASALADIGVR